VTKTPGTEVRRAADRYETSQPGIRSWHCFAAGGHYDEANISFGPLIGVDEHRVQPGAGFPAHRHRGVVIVSWVLAGVLRHEDETGAVTLVEPGTVFCQVTGAGVRHAESNASDVEPLRFLQLTLLDDAGRPAEVTLGSPPAHARLALLSVHTDGVLLTEGRTHLFVTGGRYQVDPRASLVEGDSLRTDRPLTIHGSGELLVCSLIPPPKPLLHPGTPRPARGWFRRRS
jgi:quercetin dioxygenase-like cupin family protein